MNATPIRLATRKSPLALWQATWVADQLNAMGHPCELVPLVSQGDNDLRPITADSGVGLFTKRIQQALLDGEADVAVHSLKDLPTEGPAELMLAAVTQREVVEDRLITRGGISLEALPRGAVVGTSSRRRAAQLLFRRRDLDIRPIRGNVQTRIDQVTRGDFDATILASAGLHRLGLEGEIRSVVLALETMLPAPGQAALGIETRRDDAKAIAAVSKLEHRATRAAVTAERSLLRALSGGCLAPIAAFGSVDGESLRLIATVIAPDASLKLLVEVEGNADEPKGLGRQAASSLLALGAEAIISAAR